MADIFQIKIGSTTYNIYDASARTSASNLGNNISITKYIKFQIPEKVTSSVTPNIRCYSYYTDITWTVFPNWAVIWDSGEAIFQNTSANSQRFNCSIGIRHLSSDDWSLWNQSEYSSYSGALQRMYCQSTPYLLNTDTINFQQKCITGFHNNTGNVKKDITLRGWTCILYGESFLETRQFNSSIVSNNRIVTYS